MPLLSNMELRGMKTTALNAVKTVFKTRLGEIPSDIEDSLGKISNLSILDEMLKLAVTANSLEEFKQSLPNLS